MLLSLGELDETRDGMVGVWEGGREHAVEVRSLTFVPPGNAGELVDTLNAAIRSWGADTDWRRVRIERGDAAGDGVHVRLVLTDRRGRHEAFDYSVRGDAVVPTARGRIDR